jgi:gluconokinase
MRLEHLACRVSGRNVVINHMRTTKDTSSPAAQFIIIMGVTGSGKSTVGSLLARRLGWRFWDGDDFHSEQNIRKMRNGSPLSDADRWPWLTRLRAVLDDSAAEKQSGVLACSSLKARYRDILCAGAYEVRFVYLKGSAALFRSRLAARHDHFMNPELLDSQFTALEEPTDALPVDASLPPDVIVDAIIRSLGGRTASGQTP